MRQFVGHIINTALCRAGLAVF